MLTTLSAGILQCTGQEINGVLEWAYITWEWGPQALAYITLLELAGVYARSVLGQVLCPTQRAATLAYSCAKKVIEMHA